MKLLLDTHAFIWFINGDKSLSKRAQKEILNPINFKFVSIVSIWEMSIKISLEKLKIKYPFKDVLGQIEKNGFEILPIAFEHTELLSRLEFYHRDPFDRLLIAQAISEDIAIISKDSHFHHYKVNTFW